MRIAIAALVGVLLATGGSFLVVQVAGNSQNEPVVQPLYNYGTR